MFWHPESHMEVQGHRYQLLVLDRGAGGGLCVHPVQPSAVQLDLWQPCTSKQ